VLVVDEGLMSRLGIGEEQVKQAVAAELRELERREAAYRGDRPPPELEGKVVILVDDGLATGATMRAAALAVRKLGPARLVMAVPVAALETCEQFEDVVDEVICGVTPRPFYAVGLWYDDFSPTSDEEVRDLLARATKGGQETTP
jgi:putative phosphoribosyl transferase